MPEMTNSEIPEVCDRVGCRKPVETWCVLCQRMFCLEHDKLPDGHICLSAVGRYNAARRLDVDEEAAALKGFRPLA